MIDPTAYWVDPHVRLIRTSCLAVWSCETNPRKLSGGKHNISCCFCGSRVRLCYPGCWGLIHMTQDPPARRRLSGSISGVQHGRLTGVNGGGGDVRWRAIHTHGDMLKTAYTPWATCTQQLTLKQTQPWAVTMKQITREGWQKKMFTLRFLNKELLHLMEH